MGTLRIQRLTDAVIVRLYQDGWSRYDIGLRARMYDQEILAVLRAHGVVVRTARESQSMAHKRRQQCR